MLACSHDFARALHYPFKRCPSSTLLADVLPVRGAYPVACYFLHPDIVLHQGIQLVVTDKRARDGL